MAAMQSPADVCWAEGACSVPDSNSRVFDYIVLSLAWPRLSWPAGSKTGWSQWSLLASNSTNPWLTLHYIAHLGLLHFVSKTSVSQPLLMCLCKHCGSHPYKISETKCFKFFCEVPPQDLLLLYSTSELLNIREEGINCAPENCAIHQKGNPERTEPPWREKLLFLFQKGGSIFQISRSITNTGSPSA